MEVVVAAAVEETTQTVVVVVAAAAAAVVEVAAQEAGVAGETTQTAAVAGTVAAELVAGEMIRIAAVEPVEAVVAEGTFQTAVAVDSALLVAAAVHWVGPESCQTAAVAVAEAVVEVVDPESLH